MPRACPLCTRGLLRCRSRALFRRLNAVLVPVALPTYRLDFRSSCMVDGAALECCSGLGAGVMGFLRSQPELLARFRAGEREALAQVYRAYLPRLQQLVRRGFVVRDGGVRIPGATSPDDLADVLQNVFVRAFEREARMSYDGLRDYWPYLAIIARNVIVSRHRRQARELPGLDLAALEDEDSVAMSDDAELWHDSRSLAVVRAYVATLQGPLQAVHAARYVQALSQRDAADSLGFSRPKVRKLEAKLRRQLLGLLVDAGLDRAESADSVAGQGSWINKPRTS